MKTVFAQKARFAWVSGLALGTGEAVVNRVPLDEPGWHGNTIRAAHSQLSFCSDGRFRLETACQEIRRGKVDAKATVSQLKFVVETSCLE